MYVYSFPILLVEIYFIFYCQYRSICDKIGNINKTEIFCTGKLIWRRIQESEVKIAPNILTTNSVKPDTENFIQRVVILEGSFYN